MIQVVPVVSATSDTLTISVGATRCGRSSTRLPREMTSIVPRETTTQPTATRNPLPSAPRSGRRRYFVLTIGRWMANSAARSAGEPSMPWPLSVMT